MPFVSSVRGAYGPQDKALREKIADIQTDDIYRVRQQYQPVATGGTITTAGGYVIHTFTSTGSSTLDTTGLPTTNVEYLVIAGGGSPNGSGAGGYQTGTISVPAGSHPIAVGNSGSPRGGSSTFYNVTSTGGGATSTPGGSGGGSSRDQPGGQGNGISGQGNRGGWSNGTSWNAGGGGGGAGGVGGQGNSPDQYNGAAAGAGGAGLSSSITGTSVARAYGMGGNAAGGYKGPAQPGPLTNTGSGGGGQGIVVVRYLIGE